MLPPDDAESLDVSRVEFESILARQFVIDALTQVDRDRLYAGWCALAANDAAVRGHEDLFELENAGRLHGVGWWEEYVAAAEDPEIPDPSAADFVAMYLSSTPPFPLSPRFHCPPHVAGTWTLVAEGPKHGEARPPVAPLTWRLLQDGTYARSGQGSELDARWCVHRGRVFDELWFRDPRPPHRHEKHVLRVLDGGDITTERMDMKQHVLRWSRAD